MWTILGTNDNDRGTRLYLTSSWNPNTWTLKFDRFQTFRMLLKSFIVKDTDDFAVSYSALPDTIPDIQEGDGVISVPLLLIQDKTTPPELLRTYALLWIGFVDAENDFGGRSYGQLQIQCTQAEGEDIGYNLSQVNRVASYVEQALSETLNTLKIRGVLKASREDLVAQLYKPSRVGVDEATFERYFPEEGEEMYGTFQFRGGKRRSAKRSTKRSIKRSKRKSTRR
jgi:hypothetical protein